MISHWKELLKKNRLVHGFLKRTRNFFWPHFQLVDLTAAWNRQYYFGNDLDRCFSLYQRDRKLQNQLAPPNSAHLPLKYLGPEWTSNIGTLAHLDAYVKIGLLDWRPPQQSILTAYPANIGNPFYLSLWRKYFNIEDNPVQLKKLLRDILIFKEHHLILELKGKVDIFPRQAAVVQREWERQGRGPLLKLDEKTRQRGWDFLASLGVPRDGWFVAIHVRENGYKVEEHDRCVRNAHIDSYLPAIKKIVDHGGWVIRCGDPKMRLLPQSVQVFDYAFSPERHDWLDIFFASQCRFLIGTQSGLSHVGDTFGVPTLYTNWVCWGFPPWYGTNVFLPKTFWSRTRQRVLTVDEILEAKLGCCENPDIFDAREIELIDNTPEELEAAVVQMLHETRGGSWQPGPAQPELQRRLADLDVVLNSRVGEAFLAKGEL
jgi:putative glycosyltransferase (TIGR04372 family)